MSSKEGSLKMNFEPIQVYQRVGGPESGLMSPAFRAGASSYLLVGETTTMSYDNRDHQVVPLLNASPNNDFFIMLSDAEEALDVPEEASKS